MFSLISVCLLGVCHRLLSVRRAFKATHSKVLWLQVPGGTFASCQFAGKARDNQVAQQVQKLLKCMQEHGLQAKTDSEGKPEYLLLRYNDPGTWSAFRRNEVLIAIESGWDLWGTG